VRIKKRIVHGPAVQGRAHSASCHRVATSHAMVRIAAFF
jgi:hypothetical protein